MFLIVPLAIAATGPAGAQAPEDSEVARHGGDDTTLTSPDGEIAIAFALDEARQATYSVSHHGAPLVASSTLGLTFEGAEPLDGDLSVRRVKHRSVDEVWDPVWGEYDTIRNHYNEMTIDVRERVAPRRSLQLVFRAFNDGIGFRYVIPKQRAINEFAITSEDTQFNFAADFAAWWIPGTFGPEVGDEFLWNTTTISEMEPAATPVTIDAGDAGFATLHEADLIDYATMNVAPAGEGAPSLRSSLVALPDGVKVRGTAPHESPWRTLIIGDKPGDLIESTMILNLNDPCAICEEDTSWIQPGKYVGVFWELHKGQARWDYRGPDADPPHGANTENVKRYIDFAAEHGIPYVLSEGWNVGWEFTETGPVFAPQDFSTPTPDFDLEEVLAYAESKGVKWMAHAESWGLIDNYLAQLDDAFALYERLGIPGVKTGFAHDTIVDGVVHNHYDQVMVNVYREHIQIAAKHHLIVEAHEMVKDTGERRTYPNIMTREAVRANEYEAGTSGNPPEHTVEIPFTRMVSGPMSYTPGIFDITGDPGGPGTPPGRTEETTRVHTTRAKQLAMYPVYFSGLQMLADLPEHYEGNPEFEFLEQVPTTWDDTRVVKGSIGDYISLARRSGDDWFVGSMTDEQAENLRVPLRFLPYGTDFVANIYGDAPTTDLETNPGEVEITRIVVNSRDTLVAAMVAGGGQAVHLTPATAEDIANLPRCGTDTRLCFPPGGGRMPTTPPRS